VTTLRGGLSGVRIQTGKRDFSVFQGVQTGSADHAVSYSMGTGVLSGEVGGGGVELPTRDADHLPLTPRLRMCVEMFLCFSCIRSWQAKLYCLPVR
jgi:hypothetical protein